MNKPYQLFLQRVGHNWKRQYRAIRTVIDDWTIPIYFIVPALLYTIGYYISLWNNTPDWVYELPDLYFIVFLYIVISSGTISFHFQLADQLFLMQRKAWMKSLQRYSMLYSLIMKLLLISICMLIWLPVLILGFKFSAATIFNLLILTVLYSLPYTVLKKSIAIINRTFKRIMLMLLLWIVAGMIFVSLMTTAIPFVHVRMLLVLIVVNLFLMLRPSQRNRHYFLQYARDDLHLQSRLSALIMTQTEPSVKLSKSKRSTPFIFRKSKALFKKRSSLNILAESCIKVFCRDATYIRLYIQLYIFSAVAIYMLPNLTAYMIFIIMLGLIHITFSKMIWSSFLNKDFLKLFNWSKEIKRAALHKFMIILAIPGHLLIIAVLAAKASSISYGLLSIAACIATAIIFMKVSMIFTGWNTKQESNDV